MFRSKRLISGCMVAEDSEVAEIRLRIDTRPSTRNPSREANPTIPNPPTWTRRAMITCPNKDQWVWVSSVTRPVTVTADVEVNRESMIPVAFPEALEIGKAKTTVPRSVINVKATATSWVGLRFKLLNNVPLFKYQITVLPFNPLPVKPHRQRERNIHVKKSCSPINRGAAQLRGCLRMQFEFESQCHQNSNQTKYLTNSSTVVGRRRLIEEKNRSLSLQIGQEM